MSEALLPLFNYGMLGIVLILLLTGQLASGREVKRAEERADIAEGKLTDLTQKTMQEVIPALTRVTDATVRATDALMSRATDGR